MTFSIYQLKPRFQQLLRPTLAALARAGISPNQVTLAAMLLSLAYGTVLALHPADWRLWAGLAPFMLIRMALNAIDGLLAHHTGQKSRLGALLNEICDQVADVALGLPFALAAGIHAPLLVVLVVAALLVEFAGVLALQVGAERRFDGPLGKSDRAFGFGLLGLLLAAGVAPVWLNGLLGLMLVLAGWTLVNRLRAALRHGAPPTR
ncbi:CDP-alcohol phosphatidyltransferase [Rhodoferax koreense]|uniref:CDP-alcohol phosphatidyltransferase n=1 Tax=Rhodoferax koreensis TaxID=1842727 RepID=A0A1P8K076_9BURK|nr:CDP-alcohol phosphatidyltransferase family protein [Rhodoferax koreense]APW39409.1 CDP-alcohol phosphatidyltransferase [Rhodoferax koreense]